MSIHFTHPLALLLLVAVAALAVVLWRRYRIAPTRLLPASWVIVPSAALGLIVLAVAAPNVVFGSARPTVLVVDQSASIDQRMRRVEVRWTGRIHSYDCAAPCEVVRFAATTTASTTAGTTSTTLPVSDPGATNLAQAIDTAVGLAPPGGRVVVLSDGGQTRGDALATAPLARSRDVSVDWVPLSDPTRRDAAVTSITVPPAVHVGDTVPLAVTVHSTVNASAVLQVRRDGGPPAAQAIQLHTGEDPLLLLYTATRQGWNSFQATIELPGDDAAANNSLAAVTDVAPAPRVLAVGGPGSPVPGLLASHRFTVTAVGPRSLPSSAASYSAYDAVVLDDVPATQLSADQVGALTAAVRSNGLGLLAFGGPNSFSLGDYWRSPIQQILPVSSLVPGNLQQRNLAIELVLDHSGSMIDLAGGVPKIEMTRSAARQTASFVGAHHDQLGIVDFDIVPHLLVQMQTISPGASEQHVDRRIATLQANGGTNIYLGLQAGFDQLLQSTSKVRHLILMTDGISAPANYTPLLKTLLRDHISVATVALGSDADKSLLKSISVATGGHAYVTSDAKQLPHIFVKETQLAAKPVRVTGRLRVLASGDSPVVRSLAGQHLPTIAGNVVVGLKDGAQADLVATSNAAQDDPALVQWQVGAGRVVVWTPGLAVPWGSAWLRESTLWNDALRWTARGATVTPLVPYVTGGENGSLEIDLADAGTASLGVTSVTGTLTGPVTARVVFTAIGPGLFRADVSTLPPGVYRFALRTRGTVTVSAAGAVAIPYSSEDSPVPVMTSPMGELVAQTGGQRLSAADPGALDFHTYWLRGPLTALAIVVFLIGVGLRMRPPSKRVAPPRVREEARVLSGV